METVLTAAVNELTAEQIRFLCEEFGMNEAQLFSAPESVLDDVYDALCEIELAEIGNDYAISERGGIAAGIVTIWGNAIAKANRCYDEGAFFADLEE